MREEMGYGILREFYIIGGVMNRSQLNPLANTFETFRFSIIENF
jgi:hypothetical protein